MGANMFKHIGILVVLAVAFVPAGRAQDDDFGGLAGGFYGSGGQMGGGGVYLGMYDGGGFHKAGGGLIFELGAAGPTPKAKLDGLFTINFQSGWGLRPNPGRTSIKPGFVSFTGGYSKYFITGNGVDYGAGFIWPLKRLGPDNASGLRLEYRETFVPGWGRQPGFRIAWESVYDGPP